MASGMNFRLGEKIITLVIPIPSLNEVKAHELEADAVDAGSMRRLSSEVQRKDHFKHGIGINEVALTLHHSPRDNRKRRAYNLGL